MKTLLAVLFLLLPSSAALAGDPIVLFDDDDPAMNSAISNARDSLDQFFDYTNTHSDQNFVKVAFPTSDGGNEHIWVDGFTPKSDGYTGALANEPNELGDWHLGTQVTFSRDQISDWGVVIDGRAYGYFTMRVILPELDEETAKGLKNWLSDEPLPADWR